MFAFSLSTFYKKRNVYSNVVHTFSMLLFYLTVFAPLSQVKKLEAVYIYLYELLIRIIMMAQLVIIFSI